MKETNSIETIDYEKFRMTESVENFESLLMTNNLFVDYFNIFLQNPALGTEKLKFNFVTGDLELIEEAANGNEQFQSSSLRFLNKTNPVLKPNEAARSIKYNLTTQLKSIIKNQTDEITARKLFSSLSLGKQSFVSYSLNNLTDSDMYTRRQKELLSQKVDNHSFKDLDLIEIQPFFNEKIIKNPEEVLQSQIPIVQNSYSVKVLKKPYSMQWLNSRRLGLFLQSELFIEFQLAMLLSQFDIDDFEKNDRCKPSKCLKLFKIYVNEEEITDLNPFKSKNDIEKLQRYYEKSEINSEQEKPSPAKSIIKKDSITKDVLPQIVTKSGSSQKITTKKNLTIKEPYCINEIQRGFAKSEPNYEMFKSIKENKPKTSIYAVTTEKIKKEDFDSYSEKLDVDKKSCMTPHLIDEVAKEIVSNVITESKSLLEASVQLDSSRKIDVVDNRASSGRHLARNKSATFRTSSQASYYKNYRTDLFEDDSDSDIEEFDRNSNSLKIELEDEPDDEVSNKAAFRQERIEEFKSFLKENNSYVFYKLWVDIQKLEFLTEQHEKLNYIKELKFTYNRPLILSRLNNDTIPTTDTLAISKKNDYYNKLYEQYSQNLNFWCLENLQNNLQKRLLTTLVTYWWPKFLMRMNNEYVEKKYPSYDIQKKLITAHKNVPNDYNVKNIERTLKIATQIQEQDKKRLLEKPKMQRLNENKDAKNFIKTRNVGSAGLARQITVKENHVKENLKEASMAPTNVTAPVKKSKGSALKTRGLEGYDLVDDFKTAPPIGWKRPASTTSVMVRHLLEQRNQSYFENKNVETKREKFDRDIFFEAIYREDLGGQIFMKYLIAKHKRFAVNRLKCLKELMKYRDLFYDDNFNQENVKLYAFEIYKNYLAVSAENSVDCPKNERLKLYALFADLYNTSENIGAANYMEAFKPVYEDTFNSIEEFLLVSLYDEWKIFVENEEAIFKNNEIENIEKRINIKSKKIEEMINQGLIKIAPTSSHVNFKSDIKLIDSPVLNVKKSELRVLHTPNNNSYDEYEHEYSIKEVVNDSNEYEMFKLFLQSNNSFYDIQCWIDIEAFTQINPEYLEKIDEHARMLKKRYLNKKYFFSQSGPVDQQTQNIILEKIGGWSQVLNDRPSNELIVLVKKNLERKLKNYWLPLYYNSEYRAKALRYKRTQMNDVVNDVVYLKSASAKLRQYSIIKKQRWLYSSQMVINLSKAIKNTFTSKLFNKFLTIKAFPNSINVFESNSFDLEMENNNLVNNLQFLIEVQSYKEKHQNNSNNQNGRDILNKMEHIVECYINNRILPKIRIDISEELATEILYEKDYLSPYLFLEAYLIVFNILMPYWVEFNQMRTEKDLDLFDDLNSFKKIKNDPILRPRTSSIGNKEHHRHHENHDSNSVKWRYNQYMKALKTQLVL